MFWSEHWRIRVRGNAVGQSVCASLILRLSFRFLLGPALRLGPSLKMGSVCFYYFQSVLQIGTLETLIGSRALYSDHVVLLLRTECLFSGINSEMNCIAKHKCPDSQKVNTRRRGEKFNACHSVRVTQCVFHSETQSYSLERLCYNGTRPIGDST